MGSYDNFGVITCGCYNNFRGALCGVVMGVDNIIITLEAQHGVL